MSRKSSSLYLGVLYLGVVAIGIAIAYVLVAGIAHIERVHVLKQKAERLDEICQAVRVAVRIDRDNIAAGGRLRELALERFGGDRIDGYAMLDWCMGRPFDMPGFVVCRAAGDDACMQRMMREVIDARP